MKKYILISILVVVAIVIGGYFMFNFILTFVRIPDENAILHYSYNDEDISVNLTAEESNTIKNMFGGKMLYNDSPSCGFSENISIKCGDMTFCIAYDMCPVIKCEHRYFRISNEDRKILNGIFEKYGGFFPCI